MFLSEVSSTKILANNVSFSTSFNSLNVYLTATIYIFIYKNGEEKKVGLK